MNKIILSLLVLLLTLAPFAESLAQNNETTVEVEAKENEPAKKSEKKKKEKKEKDPNTKPKWAGLPEKMSGIKAIDNYIRSVDKAYKNLDAYSANISFYTNKTVPLLDANGQQIVDENGQGYLKTVVTDENGKNVSITQLLLQLPELTLSLLNMADDILTITTMTTDAATALIENPLAAINYGKYIKDGPIVIGYIGRESGRLAAKTKRQYDVLTKLRKSEATEVTDLDIDVDEAIVSLEGDFKEATGIEDILDALEWE